MTHEVDAVGEGEGRRSWALVFDPDDEVVEGLERLARIEPA